MVAVAVGVVVLVGFSFLVLRECVFSRCSPETRVLLEQSKTRFRRGEFYLAQVKLAWPKTSFTCAK